MKELRGSQIDRQDFVDNTIFSLIRAVNPGNVEIEWDIEMIGDIRDVIKDWLVKRIQIINEQNFYPYL